MAVPRHIMVIDDEEEDGLFLMRRARRRLMKPFAPETILRVIREIVAETPGGETERI